MITVEQLTKSFNGKVVVNNVSFSLKEHTSTALIGPNGAGKTTILSMLTGLLKPTSGAVKLTGVADIRTEIGFLPQYPQFYTWQTAKEAIALYGSLSGMSKDEIKTRIDEVLRFVGLEEASNKKIGAFSGGMKQRLGIAQAIMHKPKLLLLDEPVSALDPVGRREMMNLLKKLQQETTILYSTHILNDAEQMTDQVLFLKKGELVERGSLVDVQQKYADPQIEVKFKSLDAATAFRNKYENAFIDGFVVSFPIEKEQFDTSALFKNLQEFHDEILKVEQKTATLEEIFLKVAGE